MGIYTNTLANTRRFMSRGMGSQYVKKAGDLAAAVFGIKGDSGTDNIAQGETVTFTGGTNITTAVTSNKVTISSDVSGDVVGPASVVNNAVALFDGTTGKLIEEGTIYDDGSIVTFSGAIILVNSLPAEDPDNPGQLFTDGVPGTDSPATVKVSGGLS